MQDLDNRTLILQQPRTLVFGSGCASRCVDDLYELGLGHVFLVCAKPVRALADPLIAAMTARGMSVFLDDSINGAPDEFDYDAYALYEANLLGKNRRFWEADSGAAVYRRFRVPECFSWRCKDKEPLKWKSNASRICKK